jgi:hypothetical protein
MWVYRKCIAMPALSAANTAVGLTETVEIGRSQLPVTQSHCRGQGFDSPQLHQPEAQAIQGIAEHRARQTKSSVSTAPRLALGGAAAELVGQRLAGGRELE